MQVMYLRQHYVTDRQIIGFADNYHLNLYLKLSISVNNSIIVVVQMCTG